MLTRAKEKTPMRRTLELGVEFWNDSCHLKELAHAVEQGAVGATSNPVIVGAAVENDAATWDPVLAELVGAHPRDTEDELAWKLIERVAVRAAALLEPVHRGSGGRQGYLCVQVSPKLYRDPERMLQHGLHLAGLAENVAIKAPATAEGLRAIEELVASGVPVNATVSFTVAQAAACAEAMERGLERGKRAVPCYVTLMVGRLEDLLKRAAEKDKLSIDPELTRWSGIAVFKKAREVFLRRKFRPKLLVAAYRHELHWSELVGSGIVQSIPYGWWTKFNGSAAAVEETLGRPVEPKIIDALLKAFPDFRKAYEEDGLKPADFASYGASAHTLDQFLGGYHKLVELVRRRMLG